MIMRVGYCASLLVILWELDRGRGLNEIVSFAVRAQFILQPPTWRRSSGDLVKVQYQTKNEANEMRGRGFENDAEGPSNK